MILAPPEYRAILRSDLASFIHRSYYELNPQNPLIFGDYIDLIATKLEACRTGKITRLIINIPPRHLKSHCASVAFPAWILGRNPGVHIICASYGQDLSDKFARDTRKLMTSRFYQGLFGLVLGANPKAHDFTTMKGGTRLATSVGGPLTGRGADFIIIDDPLKPDEALSEPRRKSVNEWYDNSLVSRLNDKATGCIIIIMQRLHQDDLVGHVLEQENWDVLLLPAIAEHDETHLIQNPLGQRHFRRREGDVLLPERENLETLAKVRQQIGDYNFSSQYQQNPSPPGGAMVKTEWLRYYDPADLPATFDRVIQSWDTANKATELSDFSVCTTWGLKNKRFYLLDVFRKRLNYPDLKRAAQALGTSLNADTILIEDKASGVQLIQDLIDDGVNKVSRYEPLGTDKLMRLHAQTATFENGFVLLPSSAPWLDDYVSELTCFPGGKYDDQVDSTTQALAYLKTAIAVPSLWRRTALLVDGAPVPIPARSTAVYAVLIVGERAEAAVVYFARNKFFGHPLVILDCELRSLTPDMFDSIASRLLEFAEKCRAPVASFYTSKPLAEEAQRRGLDAVAADAIIDEGENLALSAAAHTASDRVKITRYVDDKAQQLPLGGIIHGIANADDALRTAALVGIALGLDENRSL